MRQTQIIRSLTLDEIDAFNELASADHKLWHSHMPADKMHLTAAKQGKTIYLNLLDGNLIENKDVNQSKKFPKIFNILLEICNGSGLGRAYIHKLPPKACVEKHNDRPMAYINHVSKRMQMYLDIPEGCILLVDDQVKNSKYFEYKLIDFAWEHDHYYYNGSDKDWFILVFDILK